MFKIFLNINNTVKKIIKLDATGKIQFDLKVLNKLNIWGESRQRTKGPSIAQIGTIFRRESF
jgi:hypothetical protein